MCLNNFFGDYNTLLNAVKLMVSEVLMFHENTELLPSGDSSDIYLGNNETTKRITLVIVGAPVRNKLGRVKVDKEDR